MASTKPPTFAYRKHTFCYNASTRCLWPVIKENKKNHPTITQLRNSKKLQLAPHWLGTKKSEYGYSKRSFYSQLLDSKTRLTRVYPDFWWHPQRIGSAPPEFWWQPPLIPWESWFPKGQHNNQPQIGFLRRGYPQIDPKHPYNKQCERIRGA